MRVALSIMLMQECRNFICQWENEPGRVPIRIKHLFIIIIYYVTGFAKTRHKEREHVSCTSLSKLTSPLTC